MTSLPVLIKECAIYRNKFIGIAHYNDTDKIAINENANLYIQHRSIYRYIVRKWNDHNINKLIRYINTEFLGNYILHLTEIISLYNENKHIEDYYILVNANYNLLAYIYPAFVLLQEKYKDNDNIYKTLSETTLQITKYHDKIKSLLK
jgi:hypothetical protein